MRVADEVLMLGPDAIEPLSPELVLVCPELREAASFSSGAWLQARVCEESRPEPVPTAAPPLGLFASVEVSASVPVLALVAVGAIWDIVILGTAIIAAIALLACADMVF